MRYFAFLSEEDAEARKCFDCGVEPLNLYLREQASQDVRTGISTVVLCHDSNTNTLIGYYSIGIDTILPAQLPPTRFRVRAPYGKIPVAVLGRLAVDKKFRGGNIGVDLVAHALLLARLKWGVRAVIVDMKTDELFEKFYKQLGFCRMPDEALRIVMVFKPNEMPKIPKKRTPLI